MKQMEHNPDVLNCLANLSNDEVFTPPALANQMLDLLPQELFKNPNSTFLDPFSKTGVFLREIVKRLDKGLEDIIPDRQERIDHILHKQVFGMAITELTSLLTRRTLYCSKFANGEHSISHFDSPEGNVWYKSLKHSWVNGKCKYCGAPQSGYERNDDEEQYAYPIIHLTDLESIYNMKFSVICGNPPYQLNVTTENNITNAAYSISVYNLFIQKALKLEPEYVCMITPSRWMTKAGQSISDAWVDEMINCNHFISIDDFEDASDCFSGVEIKGGVNYFLYSKNYNGPCVYRSHRNGEISTNTDFLNGAGLGVIIRDSKAGEILKDIIKIDGDFYKDSSFATLVGARDYFTTPKHLTSNWTGYSKEKDDSHYIKYYLNRKLESCGYGWIKYSDIPKGQDSVLLHKVFIPKAGGSGNDPIVLGKPFYGEPNSVSADTYMIIGYDPKLHNFTKEQCENIISYIKTRFFRFLVSIKKKTQVNARDVFQFAPIQDWSKPWTDAELYKKYNLSQEEIDYIESMINPME